MKTEAEIRQEGMLALIQALGAVEADCFVYTEWRKTGLPYMELKR